MPRLSKVLRYAHAKLAERRPPITFEWSNYMDWLSFANPGMLTRGNVASFEYAIANLPSDAPILEIGSFCGLSTNMIAHLATKYGVPNKIVTCDRWVFEGAEGGGMLGESSITHDEYRTFIKNSYMRNVQMFSQGHLPYTVECFSDELFESWARGETCEDVFGRPITLGGRLSFCYIDGNHTYAFAKRDFENCDRYLDAGGFILFDDSGLNTDWDVVKVVREVEASGRYDMVARNPNWLFRKK